VVTSTDPIDYVIRAGQEQAWSEGCASLSDAISEVGSLMDSINSLSGADSSVPPPPGGRPTSASGGEAADDEAPLPLPLPPPPVEADAPASAADDTPRRRNGDDDAAGGGTAPTATTTTPVLTADGAGAVDIVNISTQPAPLRAAGGRSGRAALAQAAAEARADNRRRTGNVTTHKVLGGDLQVQ
jgi:hypothetical protein